ncbi:MAG: site-2 protease family protein [Acidobacteriota bacterium]|nr:site-2 protease family protein [Acidobacteriota bacterium]
MDGSYIGNLIIWFVVFLLSLTVHECAHAWMAERVGDPTARYLGRVTLNPIPHIDPIGTILFPLIAYTTGAWLFGWAKPVPYNPLNLRDRKWGEILIAAAGPLSNVLLVIIFLVLAKGVFQTSLVNSLGDMADPIAAVVRTGIQLNIILAVFNMIPVPPLDGSKILMNLLPDSIAESYSQIPDWSGFIVLFLLMQVGFISALMLPIFQFVEYLIRL